MVTEGLDVEKLKQIATIIEPEQVADDVVKAINEERFLILPHEEVGRYMRNRGADHARWLDGMRQLQAQLGSLERPAGVASRPWTTARCRSACGKASRGCRPCSAARRPAGSSSRSTASSRSSSPPRPTRPR